MAVDVQPLVDAVTSETTELDSFVALVTNLSALYKAELANDPAAQAAIDTVTQQVLANKQKIVDAAAANVV